MTFKYFHSMSATMTYFEVKFTWSQLCIFLIYLHLSYHVGLRSTYWKVQLNLLAYNYIYCTGISYFYLAKKPQPILPTQHCLLIPQNGFSVGAYVLLSVFYVYNFTSKIHFSGYFFHHCICCAMLPLTWELTFLWMSMNNLFIDQSENYSMF